MANSWCLNICVRDQSGRPIDMAAVSISSSPVAIPDIAALTGPDGQVSFSVPCPGEFGVAVNAEGYPVLVAQLSAASDRTISEVTLGESS